MRNIETGKYWDFGWKLVEGCTPVSEGCKNCWSLAMENRFGGKQVQFMADRLDRPTKRKKPAIYSVWNDLYHEAVCFEDTLDTYRVTERCKQHAFLVLTKRPEQMVEFHKQYEIANLDIPNVWHGVTAENQEQADIRIPDLLKVPGKKFISVEPILGRVDLWDYLCYPVKCARCERISSVDYYDVLRDADQGFCPYCHNEVPIEEDTEPLDWVIVGCETGPGARVDEKTNIHILSVVDQCRAAGVPVWVKAIAIYKNGKWTYTHEVNKSLRQYPAELEAK